MNFSIIIPIYNVEPYLARCVESALGQSYPNVEVILVDDGSPDRCPEMCDEYAKKDSRVKVIHKPNGGLSSARNAGIKAATGEYVIFLDSDDSIDADACERFQQVILENNRPDVVIGNTNWISEDQRKIINRYKRCEIFKGTDFLKYIFSESSDFCMLAPNNICRREYLLQNQLFFEENLLHEDERWTPQVLLNAETVLNTNVAFYNYYIRSGSITTAKKKKNATDIIATVRFLKEKYEAIEDRSLKKRLMDYLGSLYFQAIYIGHLSKDKEYIDKKLALKLAKSLKNKIRAMLFCVSPTLYCGIYKIARKIV